MFKAITGVILLLIIFIIAGAIFTCKYVDKRIEKMKLEDHIQEADKDILRVENKINMLSAKTDNIISQLDKVERFLTNF